ncbi:hypothetical protein HPB48_022962 [Haemaphysalis longicornis]|uniref:Cr1-8 nvi n=1 Tax=Haemaphysalis longicornis TaxID=44386 RepID=A0A9J6GJ57_HAELO|nr:hypothetical protein HPB48_022962 [Haemaphysalis longicornis]
MSEKARGRYRRYFEPDSTEKVPKQTLWSQRKKAKTNPAVEQPTADFVSTATSFDAVDPSQVEGPSDPWPDSTMLDDDEGGDSDESEPDEGEAEECDSFQQFFDKLSEETLPHQTTTKAEAFLLLLSYVVTAGLTWAQVRGLLILINTLFGINVVPGTTYFFRKLWKDKKEALKLHFFCQSCHGYIGQIARATGTQSITCGFCEKKSTFQSLMRAASFFIMFDLKKQIEALLTHVSGTLLDSLQRLRAKCHVPGVYSDITDGDLYRSVRNQLSMAWSDLTLTFNTDGAPVFESSKFSIWPVQFFVNELPVPARWNHVTISALWFSKLHPPMNVFMTRFVDEVKNIGVLSWSHAGTAVASTVHAVLACVDSPARASVLNSKQYNGYFGCSWCLQEGTPVGRTMKYPWNGEPAPERSHARVFNAMLRAGQFKNGIDGIKGPSALMKLRGFNLVWGLPPDYMHCVLEGVTKQLTELWLADSGRTFYIGKEAKLLESRLGAIKPPITFSRTPRPLSERTFWKATEWRHWLLFYSFPCLAGVLGDSYLSHFALFAKAVFLLLTDVVRESAIREAEKLFCTFVSQMSTLYDDESLTFNVHQLLHLSKATRMFGPLWGTSTFPFEDGIGQALRLVSAAKFVPVQVAERCIMRESYHTLERQIALPARLASAKNDLDPGCKKWFQTCVLGVPHDAVGMPECFMNLFVNRHTAVPELSRYSRAQVGRAVIHAADYLAPKKTCSCYVKMQDGRYCYVLGIYAGSGLIYFHCQSMVISPCTFDLPQTVCCEHPPSQENHCLYSSNDVLAQCVFISVGNVSYLSELPNSQEKE